MFTTKQLQMIARITGVLQLVMGAVMWAADLEPLVFAHIFIGGALTLALLLLVIRAYRAGVPPALVGLAALWTLGLPAWGLMQEHVFPESLLWLSQLLHVLCGVVAVGFAEMLPAQMRKKGAA